MRHSRQNRAVTSGPWPTGKPEEPNIWETLNSSEFRFLISLPLLEIRSSALPNSSASAS